MSLIPHGSRQRVGYLPLSVAGAANVTLTIAQYQNGGFKFTGVLTGNIQVITPHVAADAGQIAYIWNATTGAFSLTLIGAIGTGVLVTQGAKAIFFWDGADWVKWTNDL